MTAVACSDRSADRGTAFGIDTCEPAMHAALELCLRAAPTPYSVLVCGETGTGKELVARGIHRASGRKGPFVPLNCGAIPEPLFEAELFGARKGAFTGLDHERLGLFVAAGRGTLFLDEVGDLPWQSQTKLLRALEHSEVLPLGGCRFVQTDVRVVAATNCDLRRLVSERRFREDLYFRLAEVLVYLPPLRERPRDIPLIVRLAVSRACTAQGRAEPLVEEAAVDAMVAHAWPGNVRELLHAVAAAILSGEDGHLRASDLPAAIWASAPAAAIPPLRVAPPRKDPGRTLFEALASCEKGYLADVLARTNNNVSRAARLAGISRAALREKARAHGLLAGGNHPASRSRIRRPKRVTNGSSGGGFGGATENAPPTDA